MYKLNKNKLYYKSDQITTSVQRLNPTSEWRRYSDGGTTLYLGSRRRDLNTTYIQRWSNVMCLLGILQAVNSTESAVLWFDVLFCVQVQVAPNTALSLSMAQLYNLTASTLNNTNYTAPDGEDIVIEKDDATFYVFIR